MRWAVVLTFFLSVRVAVADEGGRAHGKETCIAESEIGQQLALDRKYVEARPHFVACAREACPAILVRDCAAQIAKLEASIATIVPVATDLATGRLLDATLAI